MTRAQQTITIALLVSALYLALLFRFLLVLPAKVQDQILPVLPFWCLVAFGAYLLGNMGWSLVVFNDVPEAYESLMKDIEVARADLKARGVDVD